MDQLLPASQTINQGIGAIQLVSINANGATQLQTNSSTLTNGASQLAAGADQLDGSKSSELLAGS